MTNDNFYRNCDFLGITPADVFFKACEEEGFAPSNCQALDYGVEVDYDSIIGIDQKYAQFRVYFMHAGEQYESFPTYDWPTDHDPIRQECLDAYNDFKNSNDL